MQSNQPTGPLLRTILPPPLPVTGPVGDAEAGVAVGLALSRSDLDDLDPKHPIWEVVVVEGEGEIPFRGDTATAAAAAAGDLAGGGEVGVHDRAGLEEVPRRILHRRRWRSPSVESRLGNPKAWWRRYKRS